MFALLKAQKHGHSASRSEGLIVIHEPAFLAAEMCCYFLRAGIEVEPHSQYVLGLSLNKSDHRRLSARTTTAVLGAAVTCISFYVCFFV